METIGQSDQHVIKVLDSENPNRRGKPQGVEGAEVWLKIGTEPLDPAEMTCVGMLTNHRFVSTFNGLDAGKKAFYRLRWFNRRSSKGPWSEVVAATIAA